MQREKQQEGGGGDGNPVAAAAAEAGRVGQHQQQRHRPRPRADVEASIDAAIEERRRQRRVFEERQRRRDDASPPSSPPASSDAPATAGNSIRCGYEYCDHTADVQLHSWGTSLDQALEQLVLAMFGYMTDLSRIRPDSSSIDGEGRASEYYGEQHRVVSVQATGHDAESLVFNFLQEWLTLFHETGFVPKYVDVRTTTGTSDGTGSSSSWTASSAGRGERYDPTRHTQGTEVKAVTYSNLQVVVTSRAEEEEAAAALPLPAGGSSTEENREGEVAGAVDDGGGRRTDRVDLYVIVDI